MKLTNRATLSVVLALVTVDASVLQGCVEDTGPADLEDADMNSGTIGGDKGIVAKKMYLFETAVLYNYSNEPRQHAFFSRF